MFGSTIHDAHRAPIQTSKEVIDTGSGLRTDPLIVLFQKQK